MANNQVLIAQFSRHVAVAFSQKAANLQEVRAFADAVRSDYEAASAIVSSAKTQDLLAGLMTTYLALYAKFGSNSSAIHYNRSDGLFDLIFEQSGRLPDVGLFTVWDSILTGTPEPAAFQGLKKRYADLGEFWRKRLDKFRFDQNRQKGSILALLRAEYERQHNGQAPTSDDDLYDFDPKAGLDVSAAVSTIATMKSFWILAQPNQLGAPMVRAFNGALEGFNNFARATGKRDLLGLFQVLKQLRTAFALRYEKRTNPKTGETKLFGLPSAEDDNTRVLLYGLYTIACVALWAEARSAKLFEKNRSGFTGEEIAFFMKPIELNQFLYRSNIRGVLSGSMANIRTPFEEVRAFLNTYSWAKNNLRGLDLVDLDETLRIQKIWAGVRDILSAVAIAARHDDMAKLQEIARSPSHTQALADLNDITSTVYETQNQQFLGKATLAAGSMVGSGTKYGDLTIVYISPTRDRRIYVEYAGLRPQLFIAQPGYIDDAFYRGMISGIYKATIGAVYITQLVFTAMGFLPVFIEAGFAGLIYEVLVAYASEAVGEQAAKINETFGQFVSLALQIAAPRPHFKAQVKEVAVRRAEPVRADVSNPPESLTENRGLTDAMVSDAERGVADPRASGSAAIETRVKGRAANDNVRAPPRPPGSHPAMAAELDAAVGEVVHLQRAEEIATEMADRLAEQQHQAQASARKAAGGGGGTKIGRVTARQATGGSRSAGGGSGRGTGDRGVPRKIELVPQVELKLGGRQAVEVRVVVRTAEEYRYQMREVKHIKNPALRSTMAHEATRRKMIAEFPNVVRGQQITGITDVRVRQSDVAYHDPSARVNRNFSGPVMELKSWAYLQDGILKTAGGGFEAGASSAQIQAYEVLADELGAPVFIVDESGRIYARDSANGKWFRADKH